ncbi:MAG: GntR family transcriptional regulator [Clostridia bacterium]|nr:GntR family transcriptional regulator [Clostridia bacterium]
MAYTSTNKEYASLSEMVYHKLYQNITEGKYRAGDELTENRIATELGVSRTPVREALKQLERENLVSSQPNRGVVVKDVTPLDYSDIYTVRALLEGQAAYWAAERITPDELDRMEEILQLIELYTKRNNTDHLVRLDSEFHELLYEACQSATIKSLLTNIHHILSGRRQSSYTVVGRPERSLEEHRAVFEAIAGGDPDAAKIAAEDHIRNALAAFNTIR